MTLLIAGLLIKFMHLEWWWYALATGIWVLHVFYNPVVMKLIAEWIASGDEASE